MIRKLIQSRILHEYGTLFVLLVLCVYYSAVTWSEQNPETPAAGYQLARTIHQTHGANANVLILVRTTTGDRVFAEAIQRELKTEKATNISTVYVHDPYPRQTAEALNQLTSRNESIDVIATHHPGTFWGPLQEENLAQLALRVPVLRGVKVMKPQSYYWPSFLTRENLFNVINRNAEIFIIAIGMTMVIITAGIDLSVGSMLALSSVLVAVLLQSWAGGRDASLLGMTLCSGLAIGVCTMCGTFNGIMVTFCRIPAFVVTLALMMIARGLAYIIDVQYNAQLTGGSGAPVAVGIEAKSFHVLGAGSILGIPNPIWLMVLLFAISHVVMTKTAFGRYIYAVGGNVEAARLSGLPVRLVFILVYTICGALTGLAGIIQASRFSSGDPKAGDLYELQVIAAVVVGGTSLAGGEGKILGTLVGAIIIAVIENGLNMAGVESYEQKVVFGLLIIVAVVIDQIKK